MVETFTRFRPPASAFSILTDARLGGIEVIGGGCGVATGLEPVAARVMPGHAGGVGFPLVVSVKP